MAKEKYEGKKILIIEENDTLLSSLKQYFVRAGAEVTPVQKLEEVKAVMKKKRFDFVVCDYMIEKDQAFKLLIQLQKEFSYRPSQFIRTKTLQKELKTFLKGKVQAEEAPERERPAMRLVTPEIAPPAKKTITPDSDPKDLPPLSEILSKEHPTYKTSHDLIDVDAFLPEEMLSQVMVKVNGKDVPVHLDIIEIADGHLTLEVMEDNKVDSQKLKAGKEALQVNVQYNVKKKKFNLSLHGHIEQKEEGPFGLTLLTFKVADRSRKDWEKVMKEKEERQEEVMDFLKEVKGL